ncbi:MAG: conjugal transfer protein [Alphaproteobacteria bacterium]|nr:conjugal transfer protein [Alphaproteobacteria bacterium]
MTTPEDAPGYFAPIRQSLVAPILVGGAPRSFAILNGTLCLVIIFSGAILAGLAMGIVGHLAGVFLARRDPDAIDVLARGMRIPPRLEI